jgi:hypothetical protein
MSNLRTIDLQLVDKLVDFVRGRGYVLDFSDATFSSFFAADLDIDIDDPSYAEDGSSKGKRLKCLLRKVDDRTAIRVLQTIWDYRTEYLARSVSDDPVKNAEAIHLALLRRLGGEVGTAQGPQEAPKPAFDTSKLATLKEELLRLAELSPQERGYAFETFLKSLLDAYGLKAREPFRNRGEQIDGSFELGNETYLVEAKWQQIITGAAELHAFHGKVLEKAAWARGVFISYAGFTTDGLHAFGRGKRVICVDGLDIHDALSRNLPLDAVLDRKVRRAAETGIPFLPVRDLFP